MDHQWEKIYREEGRVFEKPFPRFGDVVEVFNERGCEKILDLGCGSGRHVLGFALEGFEVTGLDISPTGLQFAQKLLSDQPQSPSQDTEESPRNAFPNPVSRSGETSVKLVRADMLHPLPFREGTFDGLMSTQVIHHALLAQVLNTIGEIWRILAPGGLAVVSVAARVHDDTVYLKIEPDTYIPQTGWETGLPHHFFDEERLREAFNAFEIEFIERRDNGRILMIQARRPGS